MIRVLLADDDPMVRRHLKTILGSGTEIGVVGEARDGAEAVEEVLRSARICPSASASGGGTIPVTAATASFSSRRGTIASIASHTCSSRNSSPYSVTSSSVSTATASVAE
ncbi:response regulator transcription factor [Nonomuraea sp. NPDC003201]